MKTIRYRGLSRAQESTPSMSIRDTRPFLRRTYDFCSSLTGSVTLIGVCSILILCLPLINDLLFMLVLLIFWNAFWQLPRLPVRLPMGAKHLDVSNKDPKHHKPQKANGLYFFANEINTKHEVWFSNDDMRTHALILGSTGSGKTQSLLSIAFNALAQGSGFIYVDGKGDNSLFAQVFSMARSMGREDDLLVVNYMTGAEDIIGPQQEALSNTLNPFAIGSSSMLSQLVVSMMGSSKQGGDGDMWKGRAISFVEALMRVLVYLRDQAYFNLDSELIRKYFSLDVLENLLQNKVAIDQDEHEIYIQETLPKEVLSPLYNYLGTLPGYQKKNVGKQSDKTYEQHGYITMQLTRIFGSLADVYAHIMRTNLAEVNFKDVVLNRRILVVLLPALEKSPDELANLGKLIIASLKAMLASGLGSRIQGDYKEVIESKPSNAETPFLCILDEYGYYAVEGFAVVPAQARSLGFSVVFAGQDIPAFQKASKEEAASIFANTNIKVCMKLEDPTETWDFFNKTAGEAYVTVAKSYNMGSNGQAYGYQDTKEATIEKRSRLDLMDLKDQLPGEAHVFFQSGIYRTKMFYAAPPKTSAIRLNRFLKLESLSNGFLQCYQFANKHDQYPIIQDAVPISSRRLSQALLQNNNSDEEDKEILEVAEIEEVQYGKIEDDQNIEQVDFTESNAIPTDLTALASAEESAEDHTLEAKEAKEAKTATKVDLSLNTEESADKNILTCLIAADHQDRGSRRLIDMQRLSSLIYTLNIMRGRNMRLAKEQAQEKEQKLLKLGQYYLKIKKGSSRKLLHQKLAHSLSGTVGNDHIK
ncbi:type IV secretory system conjugative DNA transfer family protein [Cysteiniphilum litorale]|uniref:type IV secretory system conjugative DNA transfer family protein n=1 Tax=Cysteiniphilum litorale TaxID=2056700 RepID=UPI003F882CDE